MTVEASNPSELGAEQAWTRELCYTGLKLSLYARASNSLADWATNHINNPRFTDRKTFADSTLTVLCMMDVTEGNDEARASLLRQWDIDMSDVSLSVQLYFRLTDAREQLKLEAERKAASINPLELLDVMIANFRFASHEDILMAMSREKKDHVKTAASLIAQFDMLDHMKKISVKHATWLAQRREQRGLSKEKLQDLEYFTVISLCAIHALRDDPKEQQKYIDSLGDDGYTIARLYRDSAGKFDAIEVKAREMARKMNPVQRISLAARATNFLIKQSTPDEHKHGISKALNFSKPVWENIKKSVVISAVFMATSGAFTSIASSALLVHDMGINWHSKAGEYAIISSYVLSLLFSVNSAREFRKSLIATGFAPNGFATGFYHTLLKIIPENTLLQMLALYGMTVLPSFSDDPIATPSLVTPNGGLLVISKNILQMSMAIGATLYSRNNRVKHASMNVADTE